MALILVKKVGVAEKSHEDDIQALTCYNGKIFSGGEDGHVKVWTENLEYQTELRPHNYAISALLVHNNVLHTGSVDASIKMWDPDSLKELGELGTHEDTVTRLISHNGMLFSGGQDAAVKVWKDNRLTLVLSVVEEIFDMAIDGLTIISVRDRGVTVQELLSLTESNKFTIKASVEGRAPIALTKTHLYVVASDGRGIQKFDRTDYKVAAVLQGHELIVNCLAVSQDGKWLYSAGWDETVNVWDTTTDKRVASLKLGFAVQQMCLGNKAGEIVVGGSQGAIAILQFKP